MTHCHLENAKICEQIYKRSTYSHSYEEGPDNSRNQGDAVETRDEHYFYLASIYQKVLNTLLLEVKSAVPFGRAFQEERLSALTYPCVCCIQLNRGPPKRHMHPEPQRVPTFGRRVLASIIRVRVSRRVTGVLQKTEGGTSTEDRPCEDRPPELRGGSAW